MESSKIVYQGDTAKYKIEIHHADFDQERDDYWVSLRYGLFGAELVVEKSEMPVDEDGNVFLIFNSEPMVGWVKATCHYFVPDSDIPDGIREEVDMQWLCFVTTTPNPRLCGVEPPLHEAGREHVEYERVYGGDVNTAYLELRDSNQESIRDSQERLIRVHKTPENYQDN